MGADNRDDAHPGGAARCGATDGYPRSGLGDVIVLSVYKNPPDLT
jgi:hypothetical protein